MECPSGLGLTNNRKARGSVATKLRVKFHMVSLPYNAKILDRDSVTLALTPNTIYSQRVTLRKSLNFSQPSFFPYRLG